MIGWERKGWTKKGGAIKNLDIWKTLFENKEDVELIWVKGHSGNEMNDFVDILASGGDPNNMDEIKTQRISEEWTCVFKEITKWMKGGWKTEDRDTLLMRLELKYKIKEKP
jgi:ribonuclease HI